MDKVLEAFLKRIIVLLEIISGSTKNGCQVKSASGAVSTYANGHAKALKLLVATTFNNFYVDQIDVCTKKGFNVELPGETWIRVEEGKEITGFEIADGGQVQVWE
jgi:hypothetical protein